MSHESILEPNQKYFCVFWHDRKTPIKQWSGEYYPDVARYIAKDLGVAISYFLPEQFANALHREDFSRNHVDSIDSGRLIFVENRLNRYSPNVVIQTRYMEILYNVHRHVIPEHWYSKTEKKFIPVNTNVVTVASVLTCSIVRPERYDYQYLSDLPHE